MKSAMIVAVRTLTVGSALLLLVAIGVAQAVLADEILCDDAVCDEPTCNGCLGDCCLEDVGRDFWFEADYLLWKMNGMGLPPLVTSSPVGTSLPGILGEPTTTIVAGGEPVSDDWRNGFRLQGGWWLNQCCDLALVGDYFTAGRDGYGFIGGPSASEILTRPFFDSQFNRQDAVVLSIPGQFSGRVRVSAFADLQGAGAGLQKSLWDCCCGCGRCEREQLLLIGGYRYYQHDSLLFVGYDTTALSGVTPPTAPDTRFLEQDKFSARNAFSGGEIGLQGRIRRSNWWFDGTAKFAFGANHRTVLIGGSSTFIAPGGASASSAGGLLTSRLTNIGRYSDTRGAVIPQFRVGVGYQLTRNLIAKAGYDLIVWNGVVQASSELPPGLAVGGVDPAFPGFRATNLVAHGLDFGFQFTY